MIEDSLKLEVVCVGEGYVCSQLQDAHDLIGLE